ncbi:MAG: ABC-2 family transporter protein [Leptotrichiaceae bacterium]|nr:ABC-2 family transporter protein [Leptotrichiaceae bacterium]
MKKYFIIALNQITIRLQYKFNVFVVFISKMIPIFMFYFLWDKIYNSISGNKVGNYDRQQMLTYMILVNLTGYVFTFVHMRELGMRIYKGKLTTLLLRPINLLGESFATFTGRLFFPLTIYLSAVIFWGITGNFKSPLYFMEVIIFIILCFIMFFYIISFVSTIGFWLIEIWPVQIILIGIYLLFSGVHFPLNLLPEKIYNIVKYNPFSLVGYISIRSIQDVFSHEEMFIYIISVIIWGIIFKMAYGAAFKAGLKRYEGMGA